MPDLVHRQRRDHFFWAMVFLAPNFLGFLVFVALPVGFSLVMAFTNWHLASREPTEFIGLRNFTMMLLQDTPERTRFIKFLGTTLYLMLGMPIAIAGSLLLAVLLNDPLDYGGRKFKRALLAVFGLTAVAGIVLCAMSYNPGRADIRGAGLILAILGGTSFFAVLFGCIGLRTMFYLPFFTTGVAQFILWKAMLRPDSGIINAALEPVIAGINPLLEWLGLGTLGLPQWLLSTKNLLFLDSQTGLPDFGNWENFGLGARDAIILMGIWATIGGNNMLLYLAGLANVPGELYEAAMIDGAGRWKTFWNVAWPQLAPTTFFIIVMSLIGGLQGGFEQARVMTNGRPEDTTITLGFQIYREAFEQFKLGYASAVSWILFLMIFVVTLVNWRFGGRKLN